MIFKQQICHIVRAIFILLIPFTVAAQKGTRVLNTLSETQKNVLDYVDFDLGIRNSIGFGNTNLARMSSPYKIEYSTTYMFRVRNKSYPLSNHFGLQAGLETSYSVQGLKNAVMVSGESLVINPSPTGVTPRQSLPVFSIGLPVYLNFMPQTSFWKDKITFSGGLSPTYVLNTKLKTKYMGDDGKWHRRVDRIDIYRPFNIRSTVGIDFHVAKIALHCEAYIELLPTFRRGTGAKGIRQIGFGFTL